MLGTYSTKVKSSNVSRRYTYSRKNLVNDLREFPTVETNLEEKDCIQVDNLSFGKTFGVLTKVKRMVHIFSSVHPRT